MSTHTVWTCDRCTDTGKGRAPLSLSGNWAGTWEERDLCTPCLLDLVNWIDRVPVVGRGTE